MKEPSVKKNYVFNVLSQFVSFMIPMVTNPYVSRIFGADGIGISSYTSANVTYFTLFGMIGISGYGQREIAICRDDRKKTSELFWELQSIHLVTFVITGFLYFLMAFNSQKYRVFYMVQFITIVASFLDINWFFQAYEKFRFIAIRNCLIKILSMFAILGLVHKSDDLALYIGIQAFATLLSNISLWIELRKYIESVQIKSLNFKRHLKDIFIFFIPTIASSVYSVLDKSVINWITQDDSENGYYEQANKILILANIFVQSLSNVAAPRMSNLFSKHNMEAFSDKLNKSLRFMLCISLPTAFGITSIASRFVPFFFGDGFEKTVYILYIFMPLVVVLGFSVYLDGMYLVPSGRRAESAKAICVGAVTNLILNIILVYFFQSIGAAFATLITECVVTSIMIILSKKIIDWSIIKKYGIRYFLGSVIMFCITHSFAYFIKSDVLCIFIQTGVGVFIYVIILFILKDEMLLNLFNTVFIKGRD